MQIKVFTGHYVPEVESRVNEFLQDPTIKPINFLQSESIEGHSPLFSFTITVIYEEIDVNDGYVKVIDLNT